MRGFSLIFVTNTGKSLGRRQVKNKRATPHRIIPLPPDPFALYVLEEFHAVRFPVPSE
jgi:hypothetical protein